MQNFITYITANPTNLTLVLGLVFIIFTVISFFFGILKNLIKFAIIISLFLFIVSIFYRFNLKTGNFLDSRCLQKGAAGLCKAYIPSYEYNVLTRGCQKFIWGGCGGYVPFKTLEECQSICEK